MPSAEKLIFIKDKKCDQDLIFFIQTSTFSQRTSVNFINILHTKFLYEHRFGSFFYIHVTRGKLLKQHSYKKFVLKMLMKLTARRILECLFRSCEHEVDCTQNVSRLNSIDCRRLSLTKPDANRSNIFVQRWSKYHKSIEPFFGVY